MEDQQIIDAENRKSKEESFVENFRLKEYSQQNYLTCTYVFSVIEKVITKFLFQSSCPEYYLYVLLINLNKDPSAKSRFITFLQLFIERFTEESPLFFYNQVAKEILKLFNIKDIYNVQFNEYILKLEFLLAWHFESNFYPKSSIFQIIESFNDNMYLHNGIPNFIYSIEAMNTIEHFLKVFEKQNICNRIEGDLYLINSLFCTEKVYYSSYNKKEIG